MTAPAPRSWLYVPGHRDRMHARATETVADAVILDLEDAVPDVDKVVGRTTTAATLGSRTFAAREVWVRVNAPASGELWREDLAALRGAPVTGVVIPKASAPEHVQAVVEALDGSTGRDGAPVQVAPILTEQVAGVLAMRRTLAAAPARSAFWGTEDLSADLGLPAPVDDDGALLDVLRVVRGMFLLETAAARVPAVDTPWLAVDDHAGLADAARRSYRNGFAGMQAIHPAHAPVINAAFTPTDDEVMAARALVAASDAAGGGALRVGAAMVDAPHVRSAQRVLALAAAAGVGPVRADDPEGARP